MGALAEVPCKMQIQVWKNENVFLGGHSEWITPESIGEPLLFYDLERQCTITATRLLITVKNLFESLQVDRDKERRCRIAS